MSDFKFELGDTVKEIISGITGIVMGRYQYLTGCNQYGIMEKGVDKDGKNHEWIIFDENRLILKKCKRIVLDTEDAGCDNTVYPSKN